MFVSAVRNLTVSTAHHRSIANLLSHICTPRDLPDFHGIPLEGLQFKQASEESDVSKFSDKENLWRLRKCLRVSVSSHERNSYDTASFILFYKRIRKVLSLFQSSEFRQSSKSFGRRGLRPGSLLLSKLLIILLSKWSDYSFPSIKSGVMSRLDNYFIRFSKHGSCEDIYDC